MVKCIPIQKFITEKVSEFLDHHLQPVMKSGVSYIKDTNNFLFKVKNLGKIDVVGLYLSIPHDEGLEVLRKQLNESLFQLKIW